MNRLPMYGSVFLIGAALFLSGATGAMMPRGSRAPALFALLSGAGAGIAALAGIFARMSTDATKAQSSWGLFRASLAGFATVLTVLVLSWLAMRRQSARSHA